MSMTKEMEYKHAALEFVLVQFTTTIFSSPVQKYR